MRLFDKCCSAGCNHKLSTQKPTFRSIALKIIISHASTAHHKNCNPTKAVAKSIARNRRACRLSPNAAEKVQPLLSLQANSTIGESHRIRQPTRQSVKEAPEGVMMCRRWEARGERHHSFHLDVGEMLGSYAASPSASTSPEPAPSLCVTTPVSMRYGISAAIQGPRARDNA